MYLSWSCLPWDHHLIPMYAADLDGVPQVPDVEEEHCTHYQPRLWWGWPQSELWCSLELGRSASNLRLYQPWASYLFKVDYNSTLTDDWWLQVGGSDDPCSILYHGPEANSELEVQAITRYIQSNAPIMASIDFHSYSQAILFPPGIIEL